MNRTEPKRKAVHPYAIQGGCLGRIRSKDPGSDPVFEPLCNFQAQIVEQIWEEDGASSHVVYKVAGRSVGGNPLPTVEVSAEAFGSLNWMARSWGNEAIPPAGNGIRDHLRAAIQNVSKPKQRRTFTHLGFSKVEGRLVFLHSGGAVTSEGNDSSIEVRTGPNGLGDFRLSLPSDPGDCSRAIRASLDVLKIAPKQRMVPLFAMTYRAILGEFVPSDFSGFITGGTGVYKSCLSALSQSHFGRNFSDRNLPENWTSTANSVERKLFLAKDVVTVVDDFAPFGGPLEVNRLHATAERILRGQGNRAGRTRMNADSSLRPENYPRGLVLCTGEDLPRGHSLRARCWVLEIKQGEVDLMHLSESQSHGSEGLFEKSMGAFVQWVIVHHPRLRTILKKRHRELRSEFSREKGHKRMVDAWASLLMTLEVFLEFAVENQAISKLEAKDFQEEWTGALKESFQSQNSHQEAEDPTEQFIPFLISAMEARLGYLAYSETDSCPDGLSGPCGWIQTGMSLTPQGKKLGWVTPEGHVFLNQENSYEVFSLMCRGQNQNSIVSRKTLTSRLQERGILLKSHEAGRNTVRLTVAKAQKHALAINPERWTLPPKRSGLNGLAVPQLKISEEQLPSDAMFDADGPSQLFNPSSLRQAEENLEMIETSSLRPSSPLSS